MHASETKTSYATYAINGNFNEFTTIAGFWDTDGSGDSPETPLVFAVLGDSKMLWKSKPLHKLGTGDECRVSVRGVKELTLAIECKGSQRKAWSVWVEPALTRVASSRPVSAERKPTIRDVMSNACICYFPLEKENFAVRDGKVYVLDRSGRDNHGIIEAAIPAEGKVGSGLAFDGAKSHFYVPTARDQLVGDAAMSIVGWCKPASQKESFLFDVGHYAGSGVSVWMKKTHVAFYTPDLFGGTGLSAKVDGDGWFHFACVTDGKTMRIFLNGIQSQEKAINVARFDDSSMGKQTVHFGIQAKHEFRGDRYFHGLMDELAVFKRALSPDDVKVIYEAGLGKKK